MSTTSKKKGVDEQKKRPGSPRLELGFPLFGADWLEDSKVVVCGGGGRGRHGVPNGLAVVPLIRKKAKDRHGTRFPSAESLTKVFVPSEDVMTNVVVHPNGDTLVSVTEERCSIWKVNSIIEKGKDALPLNSVVSENARQVVFIGANILLGSESGVSIFSYPLLRLVRSYRGIVTPVVALAAGGLGNQFAVVGGSKECTLHSITEAGGPIGRLRRVIDPRSGTSLDFRALVFHPSKAVLFTVSSKKGTPSCLARWDLSSLRSGAAVVRRVHNHPLVCISVSPDGRHIATGCSEGHVLLCDAQSFSILVAAPLHSFFVARVVFAGCNAEKSRSEPAKEVLRVLTVGGDGRATVWVPHRKRPVPSLWMVLAVAALVVAIYLRMLL